MLSVTFHQQFSGPQAWQAFEEISAFAHGSAEGLQGMLYIPPPCPGLPKVPEVS